MAEGPLESWEDLETENEALVAKLGKVKFDLPNDCKKGVDVSSEFPQLKVNSCNGNGIKILKRPTLTQPQYSTTPVNSIPATSKPPANVTDDFLGPLGESGTSLINPSTLSFNPSLVPKSKGKCYYEPFNFVNSSEPPFPSSNQRMPQITLEDNTRTQYVPQVRILQRPKGPPAGPKNGQDGENKSPSKSNGNNLLTKSYQEREAEYAKVRLRILGSAVPDYKESDLVSPVLPSYSSSNAATSSKVNSDANLQQASGSKTTETPVVRFPQGPDGSKGFASRR